MLIESKVDRTTVRALNCRVLEARLCRFESSGRLARGGKFQEASVFLSIVRVCVENLEDLLSVHGAKFVYIPDTQKLKVKHGIIQKK